MIQLPRNGIRSGVTPLVQSLLRVARSCFFRRRRTLSVRSVQDLVTLESFTRRLVLVTFEFDGERLYSVGSPASKFSRLSQFLNRRASWSHRAPRERLEDTRGLSVQSLQVPRSVHCPLSVSLSRSFPRLETLVLVGAFTEVRHSLRCSSRVFLFLRCGEVPRGTRSVIVDTIGPKVSRHSATGNVPALHVATKVTKYRAARSS